MAAPESCERRGRSAVGGSSFLTRAAQFHGETAAKCLVSIPFFQKIETVPLVWCSWCRDRPSPTSPLMGPDSFQWCPATGQGATGTN